MSTSIPYLWGRATAQKLIEWDLYESPAKTLEWLKTNENVFFTDSEEIEFFDGVKSVTERQK